MSYPSRLLAAALRRLRSIGVRIEPFLEVREGECPPALSEIAAQDLTFCRAESQDFDQILALQSEHTLESLNSWLATSKLCFVAKLGQQVVAVMWCDPLEFNYPPSYRRLEDDEAYLYAAMADPRFRGQNVAPALRVYCYEELSRMGKRRFYSYTDYFNQVARRFKAKLNARELTLRVFVDLWGLWARTFTLRRYQ